MSQENFLSKILLFGEYGIIKSSRALAMPYPMFKGELVVDGQDEYAQQSNKEMISFSSYLQFLSEEEKDFLNLDLVSFHYDLERGLSFRSTIPQGYGLGSSGALCAAIYFKYAREKESRDCTPENWSSLRKKLALMESHFHSSSSGLDPLISYLSCPILIHSPKEMERIKIPTPLSGKAKGMIFTVDTGRSRRTEPLVNLFLEKLNNPEFNRLCEEKLAIIINNCISSLLEQKSDELWNSFSELSAFQLEHFRPMIPKLYLAHWEQGLKTKKFLLKLCGAGGGGFVLGLTKDPAILSHVFPQEKIRSILPI